MSDGGSDLTQPLTTGDLGTTPQPGESGLKPSTDDLQRLDAAEQEADGAPSMEVVSQCPVKEVVTSDVSAVVTVTHSPSWVGGVNLDVPASVLLTIRETQPSVPYTGCGIATVSKGSLFADPECTTSLPGALSASALRGTIPAYVRRDDAGVSTVTLTLTTDVQPNVRVVVPIATDDVTFTPVNVVTPKVTVEEAEAWFHAEQFTAARVRLTISENPGSPAYTGQGRPRTEQGAALFTDKDCKNPAAASFDAGSLRGNGVLLYVKGAKEGLETVTLALDADTDPHVRVNDPASTPVTFKPVNVVTPTITVDEEPGWHHAKQFKPARIQFGIQETAGTTYTGAGTPKLSHGAKLFTDEDCLKPAQLPFPADALRGPLSLYVKGANAETANVELALEPIKAPGIRVGTKATDKVPFKAVNVVTPTVELLQATGYCGADSFRPAQVRLGFRETNTDGAPYTGVGRPTAADGAILYSDEDCSQAITTLTAEALRGGVTAYVKRMKKTKLTKAEKVKVTLKLDAAKDRRLLVQPEVFGDVTFQQLNVVTPKISIKEAVAIYDGSDVIQLSRAVLALHPSAAAPVYSGSGHVTPSADIEMFLDQHCRKPLTALTAKALQSGTTIWLRGTIAGEVTLELALDPATDPGIQVMPPATDTITVRVVNLITPSIKCDELVLVHGSHHTRATTVSRMILGYTQTISSQPCPDLKLKLTYGSEIACFRDETCRNAVASGTALPVKTLPPTLYMRGVSKGTCTVEVEAVGTADPKWLFATPVEQPVPVEQLVLQVKTYAAGLSLKADAVCTAPKTRELHGTSDQVFTLARLTVKAPTAAFWEKADQMSLTHDNLKMCTDDSGADEAVDTIDEGSLGKDLMYHVATEDAPVMDPDPDGTGVPSVITPAKVVTARYVSCSAQLRAEASADGKERTLHYGDIVRFNTFSFDQHVDRMTRNECRTRIDAGPDDTNVALALAAAHKYYDYTTAFWVNRNFQATKGSPFGAFIKSMNTSGGTNDSWANDGAKFVETFLKTSHGITLTGLMKTRIRNHIYAVISGARDIPHKNQNAKGDYKQYFGFAALYGVPGVHAECLAANELVSNGIDPTNITIATYMLQDQKGRRGRRFIACPNCSGILVAPGGFRVITG